MKKKLKDAIRTFAEGNYFSDVEAREPCEDFEGRSDDYISELVEVDIAAMQRFLRDNKKEILEFLIPEKEAEARLFKIARRVLDWVGAKYKQNELADLVMLELSNF